MTDMRSAGKHALLSVAFLVMGAILEAAIGSSEHVARAEFRDKVAVLSEVNQGDEFVSVGTVLKFLAGATTAVSVAVPWVWARISEVRKEHLDKVKVLEDRLDKLALQLMEAKQEAARLEGKIQFHESRMRVSNDSSDVKTLTINVSASSERITSIDGDSYGILGYERRELLGQTIEGLIADPELRKRHHDSMQLAAKTGKVRNNALTGTMLGKTGTKVEVVISLSTVGYGEGLTFSAEIFALRQR